MVDPKSVGAATYAAIREIAREIAKETARVTPPERVPEWAALTSSQTTDLHTHAGGGAHPDLAEHLLMGLGVGDLTSHVAASDPHPGYRLESVPIAAADVAADVATQAELDAHAAAGDPHAGYVREADASWVDLTDGGATTLHSHSGGAVPDPNPQAYAPGSFTVTTGKYVILCAPVLTGAQAATLQGTGMMRVI